MNRFLLLIIMVLLISCQQESKINEPIAIDLSKKTVAPKQYFVQKNLDRIVIDGKADEASWTVVPFTDSFVDIEGILTPKFDTKVKMLWDEHFLYVYAKMEEPHIWGDITERDAVIFHNNDFEVFLDPTGDTRNYGEIEINALGTIWELLLDQPYRVGGKPNNHWNLDDLQSAIHIDGTLNDPTDIDSYWSVEMAIPMNGLIELKNHPKSIPKTGEQWRINFSRVEWDYELEHDKYARKKTEEGTLENEYNWVWSNQKVVNMHEPEKWGIIQFVDSVLTKEISTWKEDLYMEYKQVAYALFRETLAGDLKELKDENIGYRQEFLVTYENNKTLNAMFFRTNFGYEFKIKIPDSKEHIMINELGRLRIDQ